MSGTFTWQKLLDKLTFKRITVYRGKSRSEKRVRFVNCVRPSLNIQHLNRLSIAYYWLQLIPLIAFTIQVGLNRNSEIYHNVWAAYNLLHFHRIDYKKTIYACFTLKRGQSLSNFAYEHYFVCSIRWAYNWLVIRTFW